MQKFINQPEDVAQEDVEGFCKAYPDYVDLTEEDLIVRSPEKDEGKVGLVIGHGIGHEPSMCGWVGQGLIDVDVPGGIFSCAGADKIYEGIKKADRGKGVVQLIANHEGDVLNGDMAYEMATDEGIDVERVILYDDIATAPEGQEEDRRGIAGMFFGFKAAGASAERGDPIKEVVRLTEKARDNTRTLAVALSSPTHPETGEVMFDLPEDQMEIGMGVHGETGVYQGEKLTAAETMEKVAEDVIEDKPYESGEEVLVLLNGSGATTLMELHILYNKLKEILDSRGISVYKAELGDFITTQEMAGFSLSLCSVDEELKELWDYPADGAYFRQPRG